MLQERLQKLAGDELPESVCFQEGKELYRYNIHTVSACREVVGA